MIYGFPGNANNDASVTQITLTSTTATQQVFKTLNCYQCKRPMILLSGTVILSNTLFQDINPTCYTAASSSNNPLGALITFLIQKPYMIGMSGT